MSLLSYNESIEVCAQQENPFVVNKPYNPDHVFGWVVDHLLSGEPPLTTEEAEHAKLLYTATIETLLGQDLAVTEANIIQHRDEILVLAGQLCAESSEGTATVEAKETSVSPAPTGPQYPCLTEGYFEVQGIRVPKLYVTIAAGLVLLLLLIKLLK